MESLGNLGRIEGFKVNADVNGRAITVEDTGMSFVALIYSAADIDPGMPLGSDIREKDIIETLRDWAPGYLLIPTAKSQVRASCDGVQMVITKRQDNVANPFVRFEVVKIV